MQLIPEVRTRLDSQGLSNQVVLFERWAGAWSAPFLPERPWSNGSNDMIDSDSLLSLNLLADLFATQEHIALVVDAEQSTVLLDLIGEARAALSDVGDLPVALRTVILDRLHDIAWAVEHYNVAGAAGLQGALDRLGAELARTSRFSGAWRRKVGAAFLYGWMIFSHVDDVQDSLEASQHMVHEIVEWTQDLGPLVAPAVPALEAARDAGSDDDVVDAEVVEDEQTEG